MADRYCLFESSLFVIYTKIEDPGESTDFLDIGNPSPADKITYLDDAVIYTRRRETAAQEAPEPSKPASAS